MTPINLYLTAKLGDGCISKQKSCRHHQITFSGTDADYIKWKAKYVGYEDRLRVSEQHPDSYGDKPIYSFRTSPFYYADVLADLTYKEAIDRLSINELIIWYLDDGSWHKKKHFMHLYCNMLNDEETLHLIDKFESLLSFRPAMRKDVKKSGKSYNYLYIGTKGASAFGSFVESFICKNKLYGMYYKVGLFDRPTTIPQGSRGQETSKQVAA
jgi:hypothetical protein